MQLLRLELLEVLQLLFIMLYLIHFLDQLSLQLLEVNFLVCRLLALVLKGIQQIVFGLDFSFQHLDSFLQVYFL